MEKCEHLYCCQVLATLSAFLPFCLLNTRSGTHTLFVQSCMSILLRLLTVWHPQAEISSLQQLLLTKNAEIESLHTQLQARPSLSAESLERGKRHHPAFNLQLSLTGDNINGSFLHSRGSSSGCGKSLVSLIIGLCLSRSLSEEMYKTKLNVECKTKEYLIKNLFYKPTGHLCF